MQKFLIFLCYLQTKMTAFLDLWELICFVLFSLFHFYGFHQTTSVAILPIKRHVVQPWETLQGTSSLAEKW